jgi:hypothetical protein
VGTEQATVESVLEYLEISNALQARLKMHFTENGVLNPDDDESSASTEKSTGVQNDESNVDGENHRKENEANSEPKPEVQAPRRKDPPETIIMEAECVMVSGQNENITAEEEEEQIELAKALSIMDQIPEGKPPALSDEEYEKQRRLAQEQESLENELRQQANEELEEKLQQVERDFLQRGQMTPPKETDEEEEVPGTPNQTKNPTVVTPKEPSKLRDEIICNDDREVSNLTAPTVLAGVSSEATHPSDVSTVTSKDGTAADQPMSATASATRAMPPRSCKKTRSTQ